jgi:hypothetical protein
MVTDVKGWWLRHHNKEYRVRSTEYNYSKSTGSTEYLGPWQSKYSDSVTAAPSNSRMFPEESELGRGKLT